MGFHSRADALADYRLRKKFGADLGERGGKLHEWGKAVRNSLKKYSKILLVFVTAFATLISGCGSDKAPDPLQEAEGAPADQNVGERIFIDTRFAEYFAESMTGVNDPLPVGDPVVAQVNTPIGMVPGPFAGESINCRSCHFVVEFQNVQGVGNRTYADFSTHSPMPRLINGINSTPRNAMQMVGSLQPHNSPQFLHFDGEFASPEDLVLSTLTGRNFGWAPAQYQQAISHIAQVIREDNGNNFPSNLYTHGLTYAQIFLGTDPTIPADSRLPAQYHMDVTTASDQAIVDNMAKLVAAYMEGLLFKQDEFGRYIASPYDVFLRVNHLPTQPKAGETEQQYGQRLLGLLQGLSSPKFIDGSFGSFKYHSQAFAFGATELQGLIIFMKAAPGATDGSQHAGNCAACHVPPNFTDFKFHNNGASQEEYDAANGTGTFAQLVVPGLTERTANFDLYLPPSANHPNATERFRHPAVAGNPQYADLGLWNVYLNGDIPNPQTSLTTVVCASASNCAVDQGLATTIAQFKTPMLRDLEDSAPYFHNGSKPKFDDVVNFYINSSQLAKQGLLRNGAVEFGGMSISASDLNALVAFLKSLTEDYDDA
jgi:cytochrome c peroxidase